MKHVTTQPTDAEKLAEAVAEVQSLVIRYRGEGRDEMFVSALDDLVRQWEPVTVCELANS